ncbi:MAG TPA: hypothetical protein VE988_22835 [Gemmataceae bacterium]|nr:hypothetical protein [Gemmataceae bacterium]
MRRTFTLGVLTLSGIALLAAPAVAQVIVRGPLGRTIVVPAPVTVRVGPGVVVGTPASTTVVAPGAVVVQPYQPIVVSKATPVVRPDVDSNVLPQPRVLPGDATTPPGALMPPQPVAPAVAPVTPKDFVKTFKPGPNPGTYEVTFEHPLSRKTVAVPFLLPAGTPKVSLHGNNLLVFDYGRGQEVTIRFQASNKVQVTWRN